MKNINQAWETRGEEGGELSITKSYAVDIILLDCLIWKITEKLVPWCSMRVSIYYELLKYNWHVHWLLSIHNEPFLSMNIRPLRLKKVPGSRNGVYGTPWWDMFVEWLKSYDCYLWLRSSSLSLNTGLQSVQLIKINKCYRSTLETVISSLQYLLDNFWTVLSWFCSFCCCCCCCFSLSVACYVISGSINCLTFHDNTHMLSASEDRTISVWECQKWECLKVLKGHR